MALTNYTTGETLHDSRAITDRLAGAFAAAGESAEGTLCAYWDHKASKWDYVSPQDADHYRDVLGYEVVTAFYS